MILLTIAFLLGYFLAVFMSYRLDRLTFSAQMGVHVIGVVCSLGIPACFLVLSGAI